jgi:hypothetical protein
VIWYYIIYFVVKNLRNKIALEKLEQLIIT